MDNSIIVALITGGLSLIGVLIANRKQGKEIDHKLETQQAIINTKIDELTREVREHNNFSASHARRGGADQGCKPSHKRS